MISNLISENNVFEKSGPKPFPVVCSSLFHTTGKDFYLGFIMQCWRVKNWNEIYEINRTRELKKMSWIPIPIKLSGDGYTLIMSQDDGPAIFGAWIAMLEVAAGCDPRGTLLRSAGIPHDAAGISRQSRVPEKIVKRMLDFCYKNCKWLEIIEIESMCGNPAPSCDNPALTCAVQEREEITEHNITENRKEKKHSFEDSPFYDYDLFKDSLKPWSEEKIKKYYDAAISYSGANGGKYLNWILAVKAWERKDAEKPQQRYGRQEVSMQELRDQAERIKLS